MKKTLYLVAVLSLAAPVIAFAAPVTVGPIYSVDDSFVYSSVPTFNYGTVTNLLASKAFDGSGNPMGERQSYLKFPLADLAAYNLDDIVSLKLNVYVNTTAGGPVVAVHSTDDWTEGGITWNNKPLLGAQLGISQNLTPNNAYYPIELLGPNNGWLGVDISDGYLTTVLTVPAGVTESTAYYFNSDEAGTGNRPYLLATVPEPASLGLILAGGLLLAGRRRKA